MLEIVLKLIFFVFGEQRANGIGVADLMSFD